MGFSCREKDLTSVRNQKELPTSNLVDQSSGVGGNNQRKHALAGAELLDVSNHGHSFRLSDTYSHLLVLTSDTSTGVHKVDVVGEQSAAAVL